MQRYSRIASYNLSIATNPRKYITNQQNCVLLRLQYRSNCSHFGPLQKHDIEELQPAILHDNRKYWARHHLFATVPSAYQHLVPSHQEVLGMANLETCQHHPWSCSVDFRALLRPSHSCTSGAPAISSDIQVYMFRKVCSAPFVCCDLTGLASRAYFEEFISSVTWMSSSRKGKRAAIHVCSTELLSTQIHLHHRFDQGARHLASLHEHASAHTLGYGHLADLFRHLGVANSADRGF